MPKYLALLPLSVALVCAVRMHRADALLRRLRENADPGSTRRWVAPISWAQRADDQEEARFARIRALRCWIGMVISALCAFATWLILS